ncbi:prokineticin-2 [Fukomys damarensis]|uniref:prokineticin-2 n=1 Tax=Fukomys damarensis TaxID=885580 RepID=UPI001454EF9B|nr:prokineticin-2 [Fukomys damarensis]
MRHPGPDLHPNSWGHEEVIASLQDKVCACPEAGDFSVSLWCLVPSPGSARRKSQRPCTSRTACDKDPQCGRGMCCAVSIWVKSIRICTPMGKVGDSCHPQTRKNHFGNGRQERRKRKRRKRKKEVPFFGRRMHHTCPCMPGLACLRTSFKQFICLARK